MHSAGKMNTRKVLVGAVNMQYLTNKVHNKGIFASHLCRNMWKKWSVALERKVVLVFV